MRDDAGRWNERYRNRPAVSPLAPEPLGVRTELIELVPNAGRALDIACGLGAQTLWLARRGLVVTALDVSPLAVAAVVAGAASAGVEDRVTATAVDLDDGIDPASGPYDVIVCQRYRQPTLYGSIRELLRPGGLGIVTVLSEVGASDPGPYHARRGELVDSFGDLSIEYSAERDGVATVLFHR
jgi:2-polyprenyl-3-methyl-5-hydroxy-6-metoxy-1,4-benzoquinol methylase